MKTSYQTTVLKTKQSEFFNFLRSLGFTKEDLKLTATRGDYHFYELDLSKKDMDIRSELNKHQVDFL